MSLGNGLGLPMRRGGSGGVAVESATFSAGPSGIDRGTGTATTTGTGGTIVDANGLLRHAPHNHITHSENFNHISWLRSTCVITVDDTLAPNGTLTADRFVANDGTQGYVSSPAYSYIAGRTYTASCHVKAAGYDAVYMSLPPLAFPGVTVHAEFDLTAGTIIGTDTDVTATIEDAGNGWFRCTLTAKADASVAGYGIGISDGLVVGNGTDGIYLWGAQLEENISPSEYVPTTTAAVWAPRLTHRYTENLLTQTNDLTHADWTALALGVTAGGAAAPIPGADAFTLTENTTGTDHTIHNATITEVEANEVYTISVFAKAAGRRFAVLEYSDTLSTDGARMLVDLEAGRVEYADAYGGGTLVDYRLVEYANGWWRLILTASTADTQMYLALRLSPDETQGTTTVPSYKGDPDKGLYVAGPQLQKGHFCDAYVASGATATGDWEPHGWVSESGTTNELTAPRDLSDAAWYLQNETITKTQDATGLDGSANTAWTLEDNSATNHEALAQDISVANDSSSHTFSAFFKKTASASSFPGLFLGLAAVSPTANLFAAVTVNTDTGTLTEEASSVAENFYSEDWGDWWRVVISVTNNSSGRIVLIPRVYAAIATTDTGTWTVATTGTCVVDYPQVELNTSRASTPCLGVRTDDEIKIATSSIGGWDATQYTMLVEAEHSSVYASMEGSAISDRVQALYDTGDVNIEIVDGGVEQAQDYTHAAADDTMVRAVASIKANQFYTVANRGPVVADYSGTMPDATTLYIGRSSGSVFKEGVVRRVALWNTALEKEAVLRLARERKVAKGLSIEPAWAYNFLDNGGMPDTGTGNLNYDSLGYEGTAFDSNGLLRSGRWRPEKEHIGAFMKRGDPKLTMLPVGTTGPELVTNGTFDADVAGWTGNFGATLAYSGGTMEVTSDGSSAIYTSAHIGLIAGETYKISFDLLDAATLTNVGFGPTGNATLDDSYGIPGTGLRPAQTYTATLTATSDNAVKFTHGGGGTQVFRLDNISVKKVAYIHAIDCDGVDADDDSDGYVSKPISGVGVDEFTLEAWVRTDDTVGEQVVAAWWSSNNGASSGVFRGALVSWNPTSAFQLYVAAGPAYESVLYPVAGIGTYHIAIVCNGTDTRLYVDGELAVTIDAVPLMVSDMTVQAGRNSFDRNPINAADPFPLNGAIGEVALWRTARYTADFTPRVTPINAADPDLIALFQPRPEYEIKGNPKIVPAPWGRAFGHALDCDGVDADDDSDGVVAPVSGVGVTAFTLEATVRFDRLTDTEIIVTWAKRADSDDSGVVIYKDTSDTIRASWFNGSDTATDILIGLTATTGIDYSVCVDFDGATFRLYVDGAEQDSGAVSQSSWTTDALLVTAARNPIFAGAAQPEPLDGRIGEVRLSNIARYTADYTPASEPFVWDANTMALFQPGKGFQPARRQHTYYENLLTYSEDFENAVWNQAAAGLTRENNQAIAPDGQMTGCLLTEGPSNDHHRIGVAIGALAPTDKRFSFYAKAAGRTLARAWSFTGGDTSVRVFDLEAGTASGLGKPKIEDVGNGWFRCSCSVDGANETVVVGPAIAANGTAAYQGDGTSGIYIWGAQLVRSPNPGPYTKTAGAAAGSWQSDGALSEESRTNSLIASRDLDDAAWVSHNVAASKVQNVVGVDGVANSAWTIEDAHAVSVADIKQELAISTSTDTHTGSVLFKKTTSATTFPGVLIGTGASSASFPNSYYIAFNTNTGVGTENAGAAGTGGFYVEDRGEWWEVVINVVADNSHTLLALIIYPAIAESDTDTWDGTLTGSCVIDYPQVELNTTFASSPIETGAAAVTRSADNIEVANSDITDFPTGAMTLYAECVKSRNAQANSGDDEILVEPYADNNNRTPLHFGSVTNAKKPLVNAVTASVQSPDGVSGAIDPGAGTKFAASIATNDVEITADGTSSGSPDGSHTLADLSAGDTGIGSRVSAGGYWVNSTIAEVRIYPYALSDEEREEETG